MTHPHRTVPDAGIFGKPAHEPGTHLVMTCDDVDLLVPDDGIALLSAARAVLVRNGRRCGRP